MRILKALSLVMLLVIFIFLCGFIHDVRMYKIENNNLKLENTLLVEDVSLLAEQLVEKEIYLKSFEDEYVGVLPLKGKIRVTSEYRSNKRPDHEGIDIVSEIDTIFAIRTGYASRHQQLDSLGNLVGYGNYIRIVDNKYTVDYGHLSKFLIKNKKVQAGEPIAIMGSTGTSTAKHLHLTIHKNTINPRQMLWVMWKK